jgi:ribosomal protein S18 acetylase RimI-like enzyme
MDAPRRMHDGDPSWNGSTRASRSPTTRGESTSPGFARCSAARTGRNRGRATSSSGLLHAGRLVGFARVVTDRATVGYLCDFVIAKEHQRKGIGKWMLARILEHPDLRLCRIDLFTRDAQEFYRAFGFGPHRFTSMVRYPPESELGKIS